MNTPPVPLRLMRRPLQSGLAVPYVSVRTADGRSYLGSNHGRRVEECLYRGLCSACGQPLDPTAVAIVAADRVAEGYTSEPPLHPECARYSALACPMLNGTMPNYRRGPAPHLGKACDTPGCDCGGWVEADLGHATRDGDPAPAWVLVWLREWAIAVNDAGQAHGVTWSTPLRVRPVITAPA